MNSKERYFFIGESDIATTGEAAMFSLSSFLGMTPQNSARVQLHFKARCGEELDDLVVFTINQTTPAINTKTFMERVVGILQTQKVFTTLNDSEAGVSALPHEIFSTNSITTEAGS
tara:strand:+ start:468 stop:815 length:348 start_codon:yes stop_codon:yes gene_type:complete